MFSTLFDTVWVRFCLSGTLLTAFWATELFVRRTGAPRAVPAVSRWVKPIVPSSVLGFYALIGPTGGTLLAGVGNGAGIALATLACLWRLRHTRRSLDWSAQSMFYLALPLAVGAPWGLVVLSLPVLATSLYYCHRAELDLTRRVGGTGIRLSTRGSWTGATVVAEDWAMGRIRDARSLRDAGPRA